MDVAEQRRLLDLVAEAAAAEGCIIAPVGSLFFLFEGTPRNHTKDVDAVVHEADLSVGSVATLVRVASRLGQPELAEDRALVVVRPPSADPMAKVELIRGRSSAKGGFFPRELLENAAREAERRGNLLIYPLEYILLLKADAAIDREERAAKDPARSEEHQRRADAFRADVFAEVGRALLESKLDRQRLEAGVRCLKRKRQEAVLALLSAAGGM